MLQSFFPVEPPANMDYHTHIVAEVLESLEINHSLPKQITMSLLRAEILENPSYVAPGLDNIPGFILKISMELSYSHISQINLKNLKRL